MALAGYNTYPGQSYTVAPRYGYSIPQTSRATSTTESSGTTQSQGGNTAQSFSQSFIPNYSQTPILESIAQYAENMAPQVYDWGMSTYAKNQGQINQLLNSANSFASGARLAADVGQAEAGVQQAGEAGRQSSIRDLQSYGIDPSAGRYAELDKANRVQTAAAAAGAGNQQRMADIAQANAMRQQGISASEQNAMFGNQVGQTANAFLGTAIRLPYSPLGTSGQSQSSGFNVSSGQNQSRGSTLGPGWQAGGGGFPSGGGGAAGGGTRWDSQPQESQPYISGYDPYANLGTQPSGGVWPGGGGTPDYSTDTSLDAGTAAGESIATGGGGSYAEGGEVPASLSPSAGLQTDDVDADVDDGSKAKINVGEFIIPKDVAQWKGEEFFHNLIAKSRKIRATGGAPQAAHVGFNLGGAI